MKQQKMTPWEFKQYIEGRGKTDYTLRSDSQDWADPFSVSPDFSLHFSRLMVGVNPHHILLLGQSNDGGNMLRINNVKYMLLEDAERSDKAQIDVYCRTPVLGCAPTERVYRILAS